MFRYEVAHIREQGVDLIIIRLKSSFKYENKTDQYAIISELQLKASDAGLAGTVVPVWDNGGGQMGFIAPRSWHPFFKIINLEFVTYNINKELYW